MPRASDAPLPLAHLRVMEAGCGVALLAFRLDVNEWRGERRVQFLVEGVELPA